MEKSNALSMRSLRLFRRRTMVPNIKTTTRTKTPAEAKVAIITGLFCKKDTALVDGDWDGDGASAWVGSALVVVTSVVDGTLGVELGGSVSEGVEDANGIEEEKGLEELATGELMAESEGSGLVVVLVTLLKHRVERNAFVAEYELTAYSTKKQTVRPVRTARTLPYSSRFECFDLFDLLMRVEQRQVRALARRCFEAPSCLLGT